MRVGVLWMVMLCLSDGEVTRCSVQSIITASKLGKVSISCPPVMAKRSEFTFLLLFNNSSISEITLKQSDTANILFSGQFEVTANNSGMYICRRVMMYPPPFRQDCHSTELKVDETNGTASAVNQSCPDRSPSILEPVLWAGCGVLLAYSLSITCIVIWRRLKRDDEDENVYVNTRPGDLRKPYKV